MLTHRAFTEAKSQMTISQLSLKLMFENQQTEHVQVFMHSCDIVDLECILY